MSKQTIKGFTLLEILVALFIFAIISAIMASAMHSIFSSQERTEARAKQFDELQMAMLIFSRDIQQIIDRPTSNPTGGIQKSLEGTSSSISFTHAGLANPAGMLNRSTLQRSNYSLDKNIFIRTTYAALDPTNKTPTLVRKLFSPVTDIRFEYIDEKNQKQNTWPPLDQQQAALPKAVRITLTIPEWGKLTQLYVISGASLAAQPSPPPPPKR